MPGKAGGEKQQDAGRDMEQRADVIIIGAGVSGCAIAREISRLDLSVLVIEKEEDVCCGTSKANSAIVHAGYDAVPGSLKARLNVVGSSMMEKICADLDVPYRRIGSLVVCRDDEDRSVVEKLYAQGIRNGVPDLRIVEREELREMEPHISSHAECALYAPTAGIVCPFELTQAYAENAAKNGVSFLFDTKVLEVEQEVNSRLFVLHTDRGDFRSRLVVNAAGVYADRFHNMVSRKPLHITPRRGSYQLLDKSAGSYVNHVIFPLPSDKGKGILVSQTVHGNLLVGPTAVAIDDPEGTETTAQELEDVRAKSGRYIEGIPFSETITSFAGLRATEDGKDFVIGEQRDCIGFVDCAGIDSPGLSSAPAIGVMVAGIVKNSLHAETKEHFEEKREGIIRPKELSADEYRKLISERPEFGTIVCRCESVTEGEIVDAIRRVPGARSLDGVKRRTRAGMGRCQAGFCSPKVMQILARERKVPLGSITKAGAGSELLVGRDKETGFREAEAEGRYTADAGQAEKRGAES